MPEIKCTIYCGRPCAAGSAERPDAAPTLWGIVLNHPADPCALKQLSEQVQGPTQPADKSRTDTQADQSLVSRTDGGGNLRQPCPAWTAVSTCYCALLWMTSCHSFFPWYDTSVSRMMVQYLLYGRKLVLVCPCNIITYYPTKGPLRA